MRDPGVIIRPLELEHSPRARHIHSTFFPKKEHPLIGRAVRRVPGGVRCARGRGAHGGPRGRGLGVWLRAMR
jgi:hypothetical protein